MGKTGLTVPRVCFGTMTFGSQADEAEARRMVDLCLERGVNFLDTANVYNKGESERILGRCIQGRRDRIVLASKVFGPMEGYAGLSRSAIFRAIDETLKRLGTDYLDLYYLHQPDYQVDIRESLGAMEDLVRAGKIRFPALSNYSSWQVTEAQWIAADEKYTPATVTQPMYNVLARGLEQEFLPMCRRFGIFTCVYNPLAGGLLTGKQQHAQPLPGTRFDGNKMYLDRYWNEAQFHAVESLTSAAKAGGRSLVSVALNWIRHHSDADCIILGASRQAQLEENLNALEEGPLSEEILRACDGAWAELRGPAPKYNR